VRTKQRNDFDWTALPKTPSENEMHMGKPDVSPVVLKYFKI